MALVFDVKVTPGSSKKGWSLDKSGKLKCHLKSSAENGKANAELIKSLSKALNIPQNMISIVSGELARKKRIKIDVEMTFNKFLELLGIDWQMDMF
ncbi:MAG TPA: DUF167 domain-containing protein [Candidatus Babeliales bacterium]|nr:DUF167 domain-containing protein [Candidatus Babeliales bacterium]HLC07486.1 DUF167 domain-containing protein [Candidatus Babeliales bacterium]